MILFYCFFESKFYVVFLYAVYKNNWHFYPKRVDFLMRWTVKVFLHVSFIDFLLLLLLFLIWSENN